MSGEVGHSHEETAPIQRGRCLVFATPIARYKYTRTDRVFYYEFAQLTDGPIVEGVRTTN